VCYMESMGNMNLEAGHVKGLLLNNLKVMVRIHGESIVCRTETCVSVVVGRGNGQAGTLTCIRYCT
jgi:hypothetical protein